MARTERGAAAVELAIILPVLLLVIGGIIDFGRFFYTQIQVTNAAREGARMAALPDYQTADIKARVGSYLAASGLKNAAPAPQVASGTADAKVAVILARADQFGTGAAVRSLVARAIKSPVRVRW